ncbi:MAG: hypothetical protein ACRDKV_00105 [Solirubrobacterales bacterium]
MGEQRDPERYAELLLLLDGAAAARGVLEGILEDGAETVEVAEVESALEPLVAMGRVPPGGAVLGGHGQPFHMLGPAEAEAASQEFRAGAVTVDFSGEEYDDLDRVIGAQVLLELEAEDEPGFELVRFGKLEELVSYQADWGICTVPGCGGVLARLDLEFNRPHRFSLRLLFDVTSHQWALRAMELTGNCRISVRMGNESQRVDVRAPRSALLMSALTVVRMLDPMANVYEDYDLDDAGLGSELEAAFRAESGA